jgi:hypothetical protein
MIAINFRLTKPLCMLGFVRRNTVYGYHTEFELNRSGSVGAVTGDGHNMTELTELLFRNIPRTPLWLE